MAPTENLQSISNNATAARRAHSSAKATILIAEDSADSRDMMITLLGLKGFKVFGVPDGIEAVDTALKTLPDLILLDLELPHLDGLSVAKELRLHPEFRAVPIIIMSGHDPDRYRTKALSAGCDDYLPKPFDFDQLDRILHERIPAHVVRTRT